MTTCGEAAGIKAKRRSRARKEASAKEVKEIFKTVCWSKTLHIPGLTMKFSIFLIWGRSHRETMYTGRWVLIIETDKQGILHQGKSKMGIERFPRQTEGISADGFPCFRTTQVSDELPNGSQQELERFFALILRQLSFKDSLMVWIVMLCVNCHQKQVILFISLQDWRNLLMAWMMLFDACGTFWTRHFVVMVWFRHELTDVFMYYTQPKHASEIGTNCALHRVMVQMTSHLNRVRDYREMQHLRKCWIPLREVQLQENPWQES